MIDEILEDSKRSEKSGCLMNIFSSSVDLNEVDADLWTGFHWACWSGKAEIVQKLLNLSYCDHSGLHPLHETDGCGVGCKTTRDNERELDKPNESFESLQFS